MTVSPINTVRLFENVNTPQSAAQTSGVPFGQLLKDAARAVSETDAAAQSGIAGLALGDADNLHNVVIEAVKAELAVQTLVTVRNKALEAYNEIMRITL